RSLRRRRPPTLTVFSGGRGSTRAGAACVGAACVLAASAASFTSNSSLRRFCCAITADCACSWLRSSLRSSASSAGRAGAPAQAASKAAVASKRKRKGIPRRAAHAPRRSMIYVGGLTSQRKRSEVADFDEGKMPTCAPCVAAVAEECATVAGCAPFDLLDALPGHAGVEQRLLDAVAQIEMRLRIDGGIVGRFRSEQRAERRREVLRHLVAAPADAGPDRRQHPRGIRSGRMLQRANG